MANPYTQPTLTGYNATPPSNDGAETAGNTANWTTQVIGKVGDPLKNFAEAMDTNVLAAFASIISNPVVPRGYIDGFTLSVDVTDPDHDIVIDSGQAKARSENATITRTLTITKQIDTDWAEGSVAGGFPSALSLSIDTWYHVFVIAKPDGTVDAGFDSNVAAITLLGDATEYTEFRRIGSVLTDGSSNIVKFFQRPGGHFIWDVPRADINAANPGTSAVTATLSAPLGVKTLVDMHISIIDTSTGLAGDDYAMFVSDLDMTDTAPNAVGTNHAFGVAAVATGDAGATGNGHVWTSVASQVRYRISRSDGSIAARINTHGWFDPRGVDVRQV